MINLPPLLNKILRGYGIPKFYNQYWNDHTIKLKQNYDDIRSTPILSLIPYFWDTDICLDLLIKPPRRFKKDETWGYEWLLTDLDDNEIKRDTAKVRISHKEARKSLWSHNKRAVVLGTLKPNKQYKVVISFKNEDAEDVDSQGK